jgi:putative multiple sugar transport system substrate-binding protein
MKYIVKRSNHFFQILAMFALIGLIVFSCTTEPEEKSADKAILTFSLESPALPAKISETEHAITVVVPFGTNKTTLTPTLTYTGKSIAPASGTAQDFTNPVVYTITAEDDSTLAYKVTVLATTQIGVMAPYAEGTRWVYDRTEITSQLTGKATFEFGTPDGDVQIEKTKVQTLIDHGIKVLVLFPWNSADCPAAALAKQAGVTVISYDGLITGTTQIDYHSGFDDYQIGIIMGQYLVDHASGSGNQLYLYTGAKWDNNSYEFFMGSWSVLQPKIADGTFIIKNSTKAEALKSTTMLSIAQVTDIMTQIDTNWNVSYDGNTTPMLTLVTNDITAFPPAASGTIYILAPNDTTSRIISDAFVVNGVSTSRLCLTGQDAEKSSIQYLIDGKQSMTILKDVRQLARSAATMAFNILEGITPTTTKSVNNGVKSVPMMELQGTLVEKATIQELIIKSGYYSASDFTGL